MPDYASDLNAIHEAIVSWAPDTSEMADYMVALKLIVSPHTEPWEPLTVWCMTNATAAQRAEAFLRVKGLWQDVAAVRET